MNGGRSRLARLGTVLSQLVNVALFNGNPGASLSARAWRQGVLLDPPSPRWAAYVAVIDRIFALFGDRDHCRNAYRLSQAFARLILSTPDHDHHD